MYEKIGTDQEGRELRLMDVLESPPLDILEDMEREQNLRHLSDCLEPVSYTHLDVYKRQQWG